MAAVFAQMCGNAVGTRLDHGECRPHRIRMMATPGIAERGNVIDVNSETERLDFRHNGLAGNNDKGSAVDALHP
jgi:hypothetical protein